MNRRSSLEKTAVLCLSAGLLLAASAYLGQKAFLDRSDTIDFKSIWLAGQMWLDKANPYTEDYALRGEAIFTGLNRPHAWFYPPNWWPLAVFSAQMDYESAGSIWRAANGLLLCATLAYLWVRLSKLLPQTPALLFVAMGVFGCTMSATAFTLSLGQTSILVTAGVASYVTAWLSGNRGEMALALVFLALKPTIGLPLAGLLIIHPVWWPSLGAAMLVVVVSAAPPVALHGFSTVFSLMQERTAEYGQFSVNAPAATTGLRNLYFHSVDGDLPTIPLALTALACIAALGGVARTLKSKEARVTVFAAALVTTMAFVPMHTYDAVILIPLLPLLATLLRGIRLLAAGVLCILWRLNNFAAVAGLTAPGESYFAGSLVFSAAVTVLAVVLAVTVVRLALSRQA